MHVFFTEWLVTFPGSPAFFRRLHQNFSDLVFPSGAQWYQTGLSGALLCFTAKKKGRQVSPFRQDDGWQT